MPHDPYTPPRAKDTRTAEPPEEDLRHSGPGIASFVMGIVCGLLAFIVVAAAGYFEATTEGGMAEDSPQAIVIGLLVIAVAFLLLVGAGLGIAGLFQRGRRRLFAILGLVFNGGALLLIAVLTALGLMMG